MSVVVETPIRTSESATKMPLGTIAALRPHLSAMTADGAMRTVLSAATAVKSRPSEPSENPRSSTAIRGITVCRDAVRVKKIARVMKDTAMKSFDMMNTTQSRRSFFAPGTGAGFGGGGGWRCFVSGRRR